MMNRKNGLVYRYDEIAQELYFLSA